MAKSEVGLLNAQNSQIKEFPSIGILRNLNGLSNPDSLKQRKQGKLARMGERPMTVRPDLDLNSSKRLVKFNINTLTDSILTFIVF